MLSQNRFIPVLYGALFSLTGSLSAQPEPALSRYDRSADPHGFTVFMRDGGWCWFQDPRAIVKNDILVMGSIKGNGDGEALIGFYDLKNKKRLPSLVAHPSFDRDDHNSPVFFERTDGRLLATYARHSRENLHHSRLSHPEDPTQWGPEFIHTRKAENERDRVTYMNLYALEDEGLLYNFYRQIEYNPTFVTSSDEGLTWSDPVHFFANVEGGRHRPYARYASNGKDTIHVALTDAHPRNFGNNLYYTAFRDGNYYKADGTLIKNLAEDGPLTMGEVEKIYSGSERVWEGDRQSSVPNAAWPSSIALGADGHPHIAYSVYLANTDNRYRLASWNGSEWIDREIAFAGTCYYDSEASYTGLVTLDPWDPSVVFISSNVDPKTGADTSGNFEIYRANIGSDDDVSTIQWEAVTKNSATWNIRPVILREGNQRIVIWLRGVYTTWKDYDLDKIGFIESTP